MATDSPSPSPSFSLSLSPSPSLSPSLPLPRECPTPGHRQARPPLSSPSLGKPHWAGRAEPASTGGPAASRGMMPRPPPPPLRLLGGPGGATWALSGAPKVTVEGPTGHRGLAGDRNAGLSAALSETLRSTVGTIVGRPGFFHRRSHCRKPFTPLSVPLSVGLASIVATIVGGPGFHRRSHCR